MIFEVYKKANADCSEQREMRHLLFYKLQKITPQTYAAHLRTYTFMAGRPKSHPIYLRQVIKRIVTMNSVHYRGILKCMKVLWGAA